MHQNIKGKTVQKECICECRYSTTSTGEPIQTATNPAPRPARRWVRTLSVNPGIFRIVCIQIFYTNQLEVSQRVHLQKTGKVSPSRVFVYWSYLLHLVVAGKFSSIYNSISCYIGPDASPKSPNSFLRIKKENKKVGYNHQDDGDQVTSFLDPKG